MLQVAFCRSHRGFYNTDHVSVLFTTIYCFPSDFSYLKDPTLLCLLVLAYFSSLISCHFLLHIRSSNTDRFSFLWMPIPPGSAPVVFPGIECFSICLVPSHLPLTSGDSAEMKFSPSSEPVGLSFHLIRLSLHHRAHHTGLQLFNVHVSL